MSEWHEVCLGDISTQRKGINYKSEDYSDQYSGHPFITIKCFAKGGGYDSSGIKYYNGFFTKSDCLEQNDIIFSVTDLTRAGDIVGSPLKVPDFGKKTLAIASMDCMKIIPISDYCDQEFLYQRLMLSDIRCQMVAYSAGSTVLHLDTKKVPVMKIRVPVEIKEQKAIANVLSTIDQAIKKTEALIQKYQQIKAGLMHDLFTRGLTADGKLRPPREQAPELYQQTLIGWIPKEWEVNTTMGLAEPSKGSVVIGPFGSDLVASDYRVEGIPVVFVRDVKEDGFRWVSDVYVTPQKAQKLYAHRVKPGDILATKMGLPPCVACEYPEGMDNGIITADMVRLTPDRTKTHPSWLCVALNHDRVKRQVAAITAGVTRPKITLTDFRKIKIATPNPEEQELITKIIEHQQQLINLEHSNVEKLKKQKLSLMHDLLTGKVPVKVDQAETAHV